MTFPKRILLVDREPQVTRLVRQASGRLRLVENAGWEPLHYLSANGLGLNWRDLWESTDAREIRVGDCHEPYAKSVSIIFKPIENLL
jgi:hypothetical protein